MRSRLFCVAAALLFTAAAGAAEYDLFARSNLVAWCIVPFDAKKRGPEERAAMLERLGFKMFAYDYRAEHVPQWQAELEALKKHNVKLIAWWFPTTLNDEGRNILALLKTNNIRAQLWVMGGGSPVQSPDEQQKRVDSEAARIREISGPAAAAGCSVALYNHGSWFGEPENQIAIIEKLKAGGVTNVGIVYNLHHGHEHLGRFPTLLARMKPYLVAVNLNGMFRNGEKQGMKIVPFGQGELDVQLLKTIRDSGWRGPLGILNHTDEDAEGRLKDNLSGLDYLVAELNGKNAAKPIPTTWKKP